MNIEEAVKDISERNIIEMFTTRIDKYNSEYTIIADGVVFGPYFKETDAEHVYLVAYDALIESLTDGTDFLHAYYARLGDYE